MGIRLSGNLGVLPPPLWGRAGEGGRSFGQRSRGKLRPPPQPLPTGAGQSHVASFRRTGATSESKSGRARNFGIQPRSRTHDSNPKFPHAIALPHKGGGSTPRLPVGPTPFKANTL